MGCENSASSKNYALTIFQVTPPKLPVQSPPNNVFYENALKKTLNIFVKFIFLFESTNFPVIMANNCIQMDASAGHAGAYAIGAIFKHIIDCVADEVAIV